MQQIAIYGAGGFGKEVACILHKINEKVPTWELIGFFDDGIAKGTTISHFGEVLGGINEVNSFEQSLAIVFAIGSPKILSLLANKIQNPNIFFPNIIHPDAFFADPVSFKIGKGNVIVRGCTFSVDVELGDFNQMNSLSALAHDVKLGSFNVLMPICRISGCAKIGDMNLFGIGTIVLQNVEIGSNTRFNAGTFVHRNTKDGYLYSGNPAKKYDI